MKKIGHLIIIMITMAIMMVSMKITIMKQITTLIIIEIEVVQAITIHEIETTTIELVTAVTIKTGLITITTQARVRVTTM